MRIVRNPSLKWMKQWNPHTSYRGYYRPDGFWQSGQVHIDFTEVEFADGGRFGPELNVFHEGLQQPFAISENVTLPAGTYDFTTLGLDWGTNPSAPLSLLVRGDFGPFYNGTRRGGRRRSPRDAARRCRRRCWWNTTTCAWIRARSSGS